MDGAYTPGNTNARTILSKAHDQQQHDDSDACSPFCTCNCCAGFAFIVIPYQIESVVKPVVEKNAIQLPSSLSEISLPIWQPPQLG